MAEVPFTPKRPDIDSTAGKTLPSDTGPQGGPPGPSPGPSKGIPMGSGPVSGPIPGPSTGVYLPGYETIFLSIVNGLVAHGVSVAEIQNLIPIISQLTNSILIHFGTRRV